MVKKNEILLIAGVLLIAVLVFALTKIGGGAKRGIEVTVDGQRQMLLAADAFGQVEITGADGARNVIEIVKEGVRMTDANCPDKWCVQKGIVPPGADTIVCLPHRLIVRWTSAPGQPDDSDEVDVVLQ